MTNRKERKMARKKGQIYSSKQKAKIVLELLKEDKTLNELASQYKVTPRTIQNWKKEFLNNASKAFESDKSKKDKESELKKLQEENDALAKALGKTTIERDWAVGKLVSLAQYLDLIHSVLNHKYFV
jgi:putative transposase